MASPSKNKTELRREDVDEETIDAFVKWRLAEKMRSINSSKKAEEKQDDEKPTATKAKEENPKPTSTKAKEVESDSSSSAGVSEPEGDEDDESITSFDEEEDGESRDKLRDFASWLMEHHPDHPVKMLLKKRLLPKCMCCKKQGHKQIVETYSKKGRQIKEQKCPLKKLKDYKKRFAKIVYKKIGRLIQQEVFDHLIEQMIHLGKFDSKIEECIAEGVFDKFITPLLMKGQWSEFHFKLPYEIDRPPSSSGEEEDLPPIPKIKDKKKDKKKDVPEVEDPKKDDPKPEENKTG